MDSTNSTGIVDIHGTFIWSKESKAQRSVLDQGKFVQDICMARLDREGVDGGS